MRSRSILILSLVCLTVPAAPAFANELARLPLVITEKYDPRQEEGREFAEFTSSLGLATFGNLFRSSAIDIEGDIAKKLSLPELNGYFPDPKEKAAIAKRISDQVNKKYLAGSLTNEGVTGAMRYATTELVGTIIRRAMEKEGIKDTARRALWADKILSPFQTCIGQTVTYKESERCLSALQKDLVRNIGLGIGHEMVRQEMGAAETKGVPQAYIKCLHAKGTNLDSRVKPCIVNTMRNAAESFGIGKVTEVARSQAPGAEAVVARKVRPDFAKCLAAASDRSGFNGCADGLVARAGAEISAEAVKTNAQVLAHFPSEKARLELAQEASKIFSTCMSQSKKRDANGSLSTEACALRVKLGTAKVVANALFASNLQRLSGMSITQKSAIKTDVSAQLDGCWNNSGTLADNNDCMRGAIESLVAQVADIKLGTELPASLRAAAPTLKDKLVGSVRACVKTSLPKNLMESADSGKKVEDCAAALLKEAALKVAAHGLEEVLRGKTSDDAAAKKVVEGRTKAFGECLGVYPNDQKVSTCSAALKRSAGVQVAKLLFGEELKKFVKNNGGTAAFGITEADQEAELKRLLAAHNLCLVEKVKDQEPHTADAAVDACFKRSIRGLALYLARLVFSAQLKENLPEGKSGGELTARFDADFNSCLLEKDGAEHSVNAFVQQIDHCSAKLTNVYTLELGKIQMTAALDQNLKGESVSLRERSREIESEVLGALELCLKDKVNEAGRNSCILATKKQATLLIATEATREQSKKLLRALKAPRQLAEVERKLALCLELKDPDLCAKEHAQGAGKVLGTLKLHGTLGETLGEKELKLLAKELTKIETAFYACVDAIPGKKIHDDFIRQLEACGEMLQENGIALVQGRLKSWLTNDAQPTAERGINEKIAVVLPCLDPLLPEGPVSEEAVKKLDPDGLLLPIARLIGDYVNYDVENAGKDFDSVLKQLEKDLAAAGPAHARRRLLDLLVREGMLDRMLKSMALSEVRKSLEALPPEDRLPEALLKILLDKKNIELALSPAVMDRLRPLMTEKLLKPVLVDGRSLSDPALSSAVTELSGEVAGALLESPHFGEKLVAGAVQQQIDAESKGSLSRWFFNSVGYSYDWDKLRQTEGGRKAETYVKNMVIRPRVSGERVSAEEMGKRKAEAARLVKEAVKKQ